jgi:hypothetical protein
MPRTHAYCYASGQIRFGKRVPAGALPIARGQDKPLRNLIEATSRHGYKTRRVKGRPTKIPGSDHLLVPGVPEAPNQSAAYDALRRYAKWIKDHAPRNVAVIVGGP